METWPNEHRDLVQKLVLNVLGKENSSGAAEGMTKSEAALGATLSPWWWTVCQKKANKGKDIWERKWGRFFFFFNANF